MATETYEKISKKAMDEINKLNMKDEEVKVRERRGKWRIIYNNGNVEIQYEGCCTNIHYDLKHKIYTIEELIELYELVKVVLYKIDKKMEKLNKTIDEL